jgi:hypothetical protein
VRLNPRSGGIWPVSPEQPHGPLPTQRRQPEGAKMRKRRGWRRQREHYRLEEGGNGSVKPQQEREITGRRKSYKRESARKKSFDVPYRTELMVRNAYHRISLCHGRLHPGRFSRPSCREHAAIDGRAPGWGALGAVWRLTRAFTRSPSWSLSGSRAAWERVWEPRERPRAGPVERVRPT